MESRDLLWNTRMHIKLPQKAGHVAICKKSLGLLTFYFLKLNNKVNWIMLNSTLHAARDGCRFILYVTVKLLASRYIPHTAG